MGNSPDTASHLFLVGVNKVNFAIDFKRVMSDLVPDGIANVGVEKSPKASAELSHFKCVYLESPLCGITAVVSSRASITH